jgi:integrase/recombinase XerD
MRDDVITLAETGSHLSDSTSSHSGRRSFISKLVHNGVSPKIIMTLAGHKHMTTTQRYIDVNDEMLRTAVNLV